MKFGTNFTQVRTKSEDQRQKVLQAVEFGRRAFPRATKKCFARVSATSTIPEILDKIDYDAREKE